ncbi:MAG: DUF2752 domain-containing protein [Myxococcales bacterium]|nr:DUF2752 domain-containing protein [Myxococcales bacterium]
MSPTAATPDPGVSWTHRALLAPGVRRFALLIFLGSFFFPLTGLSVDLCPLHQATGLPCPGCGMTRSLAALTQGDFSTAAGLNPFGFLVWPVLAVLAVLALVPARGVQRLAQRLDVYGPLLTRAFHLVLAALLGFGALRLVALLALGERFP